MDEDLKDAEQPSSEVDAAILPLAEANPIADLPL